MFTEGVSKERKFFDALKDVFIEAKVERESGYINLMRELNPSILKKEFSRVDEPERFESKFPNKNAHFTIGNQKNYF